MSHQVYDDTKSTKAKRQRPTEKVMCAIFFRRTGVVKATVPDEKKTVSDSWYTT